MPRVGLVYWDSCIFLDALQQTPEWRSVLAAILTAARAGDVRIVTSALTLAEVAHGGNAAGGPADETTIRGLFQNPYIIVRDLDRETATQARRIVREHGLKPPDAVHVATALAAGVSVLQTRDGSGRKRGLLDRTGRIGNPPLSIEVPSWSEQPRLLAMPEGPTGEGK